MHRSTYDMPLIEHKYTPDRDLQDRTESIAACNPSANHGHCFTQNRVRATVMLSESMHRAKCADPAVCQTPSYLMTMGTGAMGQHCLPCEWSRDSTS